ncbi:ATP:guanido phosphotransferase, N-terminal domain [Popillia japonica]|uniref:arginine kinase n=1 Tax=Popillia japonica TaxID=7064 RepID=A0AAW1NIJ8_POPJA
MFTLWYTVLSWKEYRSAIVDKLNSRPISDEKPSSTKAKIEVNLPDSDRLPTVTSLSKPAQSSNSSPTTTNSTRHPVASLQPSKPPRSPSPHPILNDAFEDLDYNEEETEEEADEEEEEDEDSIEVDDPVRDIRFVKQAKHPVDEFLRHEASQQIKENTSYRKTANMVDQAVLDKLEAGFKKLEASDSKSLLKKYLTRELFDSLKVKKTSYGSTLLDVIQSGLENHDSGIGIYAPDAEAYVVFAPLFDPIIEDYHAGFKKTDVHPQSDWGDVNVFGNLDPAGEYVVSTRVRCGRSLEGYPFNPCLTEAQYKEMEEKVSSTLSGLEGELKGTFYPLTGMSKDVQQKLIDDHFLFKEGDRFLQAANACRFWPTGRGIYHNDNKTFLVWCNEEDHLRIISMQMGGDLGQVYRRLVTAVNDIEKRIPFSHNDRLGFLTFCPTNLGTTVRASVHIKVPKLASNKAKLEEVAARYNLQVRGTRGEHTEAEGGIYDISNKRRMGLTEYDAVKEMYDGIAEIIKIEKEL